VSHGVIWVLEKQTTNIEVKQKKRIKIGVSTGIRDRLVSDV